MAMNMAGSAGGGGGRRGRRRAAVMAEINVTPMVDVMLVLLIIFMVAAPHDDVEHRYRPAGRRGGKQIQANAPPLTLSVKRTGGTCNSNVELYLGDTLISANDLLPKIKAIRETRSDAESVVYLRGRQRRLLHGYDETFGVYSDGGVQGEYRHRAGGGLLSMQRRVTVIAERESASEGQGLDKTVIASVALHVLVLGWVMVSSRPRRSN